MNYFVRRQSERYMIILINVAFIILNDGTMLPILDKISISDDDDKLFLVNGKPTKGD